MWKCYSDKPDTVKAQLKKDDMFCKITVEDAHGNEIIWFENIPIDYVIEDNKVYIMLPRKTFMLELS